MSTPQRFRRWGDDKAMTEVDAKLVEQITAAVLRALGRSTSGGVSAAPIHSPIGTCTGDYSKFPELAGLVSPSPIAPSSARAAPAVAPLPTVTPLAISGVITANRLKGLEGPVIYLRPGAQLSPLAMDEVKRRQLRIEYVSLAPDGASRATAATAPIPARTWCCWMQGHCDSARRIIEQYRGMPISSAGQGNSGENLPALLRRLAQSLRQHECNLAVLFVPTAGLAACMANRCANLRAVVATSTRAVQEAVTALAANVLIIEYTQHGYSAMAAMLEIFLKSTGCPSPVTEKQLAALAADRELEW